MKPILFAALFLLLPKIGSSQDSKNNELVINPTDRLVFLDSTDLETQSKDYAYIRVIKDFALDKKTYAILEYYRSGVVRMEGVSTTKGGSPKEGELTYYYKNGAKKSLANYSKGQITGKDFEWYENGTQKSEGEYIDGEKKGSSQHKINQFWDPNGVQTVTDGNGFFDDKGEKESSKGEIKNGFKEGVWEGSSNKSNWSYKETYDNGKLISGKSLDKNNNFYIYTELEVKPEPKGGMMDFYKFIAKNYRTPEKQGLSGKIYLKFIIDKDGKIVEPKVLRDLGYGTGEEALRVLNNCENWTPGQQRGRNVRCTFSLPISIQSAN